MLAEGRLHVVGSTVITVSSSITVEMDDPDQSAATQQEIARTLGVRSARAVGSAVGRNPISLIIPCHRVVGSGGALTGYAGGLKRKAFLLRLEGVPIPSGTAASAVSIHQNREDDRP